MEGPKTSKKRKLTDKSVTNAILQDPDFAQDSAIYRDLVEMERKLDWTIARKKAEMQDAMTRNPSTQRTLRIFLSHTVSGQAWQAGTDAANLNPETGEGVPAWQLKVEGRLLEIPHQRAKDRQPPRKFSTLIKKMIVEMDRDTSLHPGSNIVEWPAAPGHANPPQDGFTLKRMGDSPTNIRVILYLEHNPPQFKIQPELALLLGVAEDSRMGVIQALWNYIKVNNLQDKADRRVIRADDSLRQLFGADQILFAKIPELVNRYLSNPDPILLFYTIDTTAPPPERPKAWDLPIKMEDVTLKARMAVVINANKETTNELVKLDEEIAYHAQALSNSHLKRTFLQSFSKDPALFIQQWLESQSRDLETVLGSGPTEGATLRTEDLRRSEFFSLPWVEEAVAVQEGLRLTRP